MSISIEDFIKGIYQIKEDNLEKVSSTNIARRLKISKAAVTDMAKKLATKGLVNYKPYKEIALTNAGKKMALAVIRRHRLWELFLSRVLSIPINRVHTEAEMLEHYTSDFLLEKIDTYLGSPLYDPHGDPIPDDSGKLPPNIGTRLSQTKAGCKYTISRILYNEEDLNNFFEKNSISLNKQVYIQDIFETDKSISILIDNRNLVINHRIANRIYVQ